MEANQSKQNEMKEFSNLVEKAIEFIDRYEVSRPSSMTFTKLEEAILWAQVMIMNVKIKDEGQVAA